MNERPSRHTFSNTLPPLASLAAWATAAVTWSRPYVAAMSALIVPPRTSVFTSPISFSIFSTPCLRTQSASQNPCTTFEPVIMNRESTLTGSPLSSPYSTALPPAARLVTTPVPDGERLALGDRHTQVMSGYSPVHSHSPKHGVCVVVTDGATLVDDEPEGETTVPVAEALFEALGDALGETDCDVDGEAKTDVLALADGVPVTAADGVDAGDALGDALTDADCDVDLDTLGVPRTDALAIALALTDGVLVAAADSVNADDALGDALEDALGDASRDAVGDTLGVVREDELTLTDGVTVTAEESVAAGDALGDALTEANFDGVPDTDVVAPDDAPAVAETDADAARETDGDGDTDGDAEPDAVAVAFVPVFELFASGVSRIACAMAWTLVPLSVAASCSLTMICTFHVSVTG